MDALTRGSVFTFRPRIMCVVWISYLLPWACFFNLEMGLHVKVFWELKNKVLALLLPSVSIGFYGWCWWVVGWVSPLTQCAWVTQPSGRAQVPWGLGLLGGSGKMMWFFCLVGSPSSPWFPEMLSTRRANPRGRNMSWMWLWLSISIAEQELIRLPWVMDKWVLPLFMHVYSGPGLLGREMVSCGEGAFRQGSSRTADKWNKWHQEDMRCHLWAREQPWERCSVF